MNVFNFILTDVGIVGDCILEKLDWNDLLRLRRVCWTTNKTVLRFMEVHKELTPEIEINGQNEERSLSRFLDMGILTEKLFVNNTNDPSFYDNLAELDLQEFLTCYAGRVEHLRVGQISLFTSNNERKFLEGFTSIKTFEAGRMVFEQEMENLEIDETLANLLNVSLNTVHFHSSLPTNFLALESISIGQDPDNVVFNTMQIGYEILHHCKLAKNVSFPYIWADLASVEDFEGCLTAEFYHIDLFLGNNKLKMFDFKNFDDRIGGWQEWRTREAIPAFWMASRNAFLQLCSTAVKKEAYFMNVRPYWFCARNSGMRGDFALGKPEYGIPVISLIGLHPCVMPLEMPNLEKITIPFSSRSFGIKVNDPTPDWPALKILDINVDSNVSYTWDFTKMTQDNPNVTFEVISVRGLYKLFFKNIVRENMTELILNFMGGRRAECMEPPLIPKTEDIVASCPNLKKIKLGNWPGTNKALVTLWNGLSKLEAVELESCKNLGNVAFVGEDVDNPVFFKLKNLKKLSLKELDKMPKVTNLLFSKVLAKMELKELILTSEKPLEKVTKEGISALMCGPFAEHIAKFPFQEWSLANVTKEEFREMEQQFRSSEML